MSAQTYICDCQNPSCRHHWVSRAGFGTPDYCPKCRKTQIAIKPSR